MMARQETPEQRKARETSERAATARKAADDSRESGYHEEAATYEAIARWVEET
jgi:hypothetical protein